jgi:hypothetical protein
MYRPIRDNTKPATIDESEVVIITGRIAAPDEMALYPRADWK